MRINLVLSGSSKSKRIALQELLTAHPLPDGEHELYISTARVFIPPRDRPVVSIEDAEIEFHYYFEERIEDARKQLNDYVASHTAHIQEQITSNEQFQSSELLAGMWHTLTDGFKSHLVPSAKVFAGGVQSHLNGTNTLFTKPQYNKLAKAEFVLGATAGVASIILGFITPTIAALIAIAAILFIAAAIYHKTLANGMEPEPNTPSFQQ